MSNKKRSPQQRFKLPKHCGERYCLCSGGQHAACQCGKEIDEEKRAVLKSFSKETAS